MRSKLLREVVLALVYLSSYAMAQANDEFVNQMLNGAKSILVSIYPRISSLETISIPSTLTIDGSTYRIPVIAFPTSTDTTVSSSASASSQTTPASSAASSTSSSATTTQAPVPTSPDLNRAPSESAAASTSANKTGSDDKLAVILGVLIPVLFLLIFALLFCLLWRRKKHKGYWFRTKQHDRDREDDWAHHEERTSSFHVRPNSHSAHIWADNGANSRYQPVPKGTNDSPNLLKIDSTAWSGAAGIPGGTGVTSPAGEEIAFLNTHEAATSKPGAPTAAVSNPFTNDAHTLRSPTTSPLATHEPFTVSPASPLDSHPANKHNDAGIAAGAGLAGLAGAAVVRRHGHGSSPQSHLRSRPCIDGRARESTDAPTARRSQPLTRRRTNSSGDYTTPPEELAAIDMTGADGPYARAHCAMSGTWGWKRRSGGGERNSDMDWRQSKDMNYEPVPDPYAHGKAAGPWQEHRERRKSWDETPTPVEEVKGWGEKGRPPTPLGFGFKLAHTGTQEGGRAAVTTSNSKRDSVIARKPVPTPIEIRDLDSLPSAAKRRSNPFTSPDDDQYERSPGPLGSSKYTKGEYEGDSAPAPLLPQRSSSPQRRDSPTVHCPSGPEVSRFDFGLTREQLRDIRKAGTNRKSIGTGRYVDDEERTWSFEERRG